ncbi:MAG: hypothetical protein SBU_000451 [Candidatus Syntrophoarchaeum butanivorans]|uniref:Uncharacterized protein n=1 Tax=Candidatus Syntropharchaeum butanivorans TaxID=1839936 RepID=A0A1F2P5N5_9EURY|nr:MAG: hypothetical protein SBU_000451 [Candidatus Syntrophoarchaeum butanivorans]
MGFFYPSISGYWFSPFLTPDMRPERPDLSLLRQRIYSMEKKEKG